jgi:hypothetical protein
MKYTKEEIKQHIKHLRDRIRETKKLGYAEKSFEIRYLRKSLNSWLAIKKVKE